VEAVPTSTVRVASDAVVVPIPTLVDVLIPVALVSQRPEAPPPPEGVAQVLSPLKNVELSAVPEEPNCAIATVPDAKLVAFKSVKFAPLTAAIVPDICPPGILVSPEAEPLN